MLAPSSLADSIASDLHRLWIGDPAASLRKSDQKKAIEVACLLDELELALSRRTQNAQHLLVDAAAGKSYVGILAAERLTAAREGRLRVITLERESSRVEAARWAASRIHSGAPVECRLADLGEKDAWPERPTIVTALHACGAAADLVLQRAIERETPMVLVVPCCTDKSLEMAARAARHAARLGIAKSAPIRRRFIQSLVDTERALRLEAAGYRTEVVEFVAPTVTPHNLLFRATLTRDPGRAEAALRDLQRLYADSEMPSQ